MTLIVFFYFISIALSLIFRVFKFEVIQAKKIIAIFGFLGNGSFNVRLLIEHLFEFESINRKNSHSVDKFQFLRFLK